MKLATLFILATCFVMHANDTNGQYLLKHTDSTTAVPMKQAIFRSTLQIAIRGTVRDEKGNLLPGASVVEKGTSNGVQSNFDGEFSINVESENAILVISYIGFATREMPVKGLSHISVSLQESAAGLDEVVVIGYGTVKRRDLTGSVSTLDGSEFQEQATYSVENALAGRVAGVKVIDGAQPGAGASIQIRGSNSMLGGTEPLYVIDGIPVEPNQDAAGPQNGSSQNSAINFIDPASVERIEVLKDASATSIYGARGANGVILITSKKGKANRQELTFKYSVNIANVSKHRDILNGPEFADWINFSSASFSYLKQSWWKYQEGLFDSGEIAAMPDISPWGSENTPEGNTDKWLFDGISRPLPNSPNLVSTDWQDEVFQTAITNNYNIGYSGGSDKGSFSFGLNYLDQEGILMGSSYERLNATLSINQRITDKIRANSRMNFTKGNANALMTNNGHPTFNLINKVTSFAPTNPIRGEGESLEDFDFNDPNFMDSPIDIASKLQDDKEQINMLGSFGLDFTIAKGLIFNVTGALTYNANNRDTYWPMSTARGEASKGSATSSRNQFFKYLSQYQLTYDKQFNKNNSLNVVVVHSNEQFQLRSDFLDVRSFPSDILGYKNLASGLEYAVPVNNFTKSALLSYLGRVNYSFKDRYLFTISLRADGSSRFAKNNKWGYFPSGAFAWRMIDEPFIADLNAFSNLKLRLSYGKTGGQAISPYQSLATLVTKNYNFNGNIASGFIENNLENNDLKWETTDQYNAGIDFGFFKNRISLTIDAYYKKTSDLLMQVENPPSSGYPTKIANIGAVENKGLEVELFTRILDGELNWNVSGNIAFNRSKVLEMGENDFQFSDYSWSGYQPIIFKEGEPLGAFRGLEKVKVFETWEEVESSGQIGPVVGDMMFRDQNNDEIINDDDMVIIGNPSPDAIWGITNEFSYKSFDFSFLFDGQIGGDIYSFSDMFLGANFRRWNSTKSAAVNAWVPTEGVPDISWELEDGTIFSTDGHNYGYGNSDPYTARPMFNVTSTQRLRGSDEYIKDATFIKLRNVSLGYNFDLSGIKSAGLKKLRLYLSGTNLLTFTKFDGYDPEVTAFNNNPSRRGLDFGTYPVSRTFTFGVNATF